MFWWHIIIEYIASKWFTRFIHNRQKCGCFSKAQYKHSYFTFWFTANGLAQTTNKYCDFKATLTCSILVAKSNLQCLKFMIHNRIYTDVWYLNKYLALFHLPNISFPRFVLFLFLFFSILLVLSYFALFKFANFVSYAWFGVPDPECIVNTMVMRFLGILLLHLSICGFAL